MTPGGITKAENNLKIIYLKDIKLSVKTRDIYRIEKKKKELHWYKFFGL